MAAQFRLSDHAGVVLTVAALALTGVKIGAVARGDATTFAAILDTEGWALLPAILLTGTPVAALVPLYVTSQYWGEAIRDGDPVGRLPLLTLGSFALALLVSDVRWFGVVCLWALFWIGSSWIWQATGWSFVAVTPRDTPLPPRLVVQIVVVVALLFAVLNPRPWLPAERATVAGEQFVGYFLADGGAETTLLTDHERHVIRVPSSEVSGRTLCQIGSSSRPLVAWLLWRSDPTYGDCSRDGEQ